MFCEIGKTKGSRIEGPLRQFQVKNRLTLASYGHIPRSATDD